MKLIKHSMKFNKTKKRIDASAICLSEKRNIDVAEASPENMSNLTEAEWHAYTLENYPFCLSCQTDYPDRCDCVMNAKCEGTLI